MKIPPKVHGLCAHSKIQMNRFGRLGDKTESPVERLHKEVNQINRQLCCVRNWHARKEVMLNWADKADMATIRTAKETVKQATSRVQSPDTSLRKRAKLDEEEATKRAKLDRALHIVGAANAAAIN